MRPALVVLGAILTAAGTWLGFPLAAPICTGALLGLVSRDRPATHAGLAGLAGWGMLLVVGLARGDPYGTVATKLGEAMGLPAWLVVVGTLAYPAILAASAATLAALVRGGGTRPPPPGEARRQRAAA